MPNKGKKKIVHPKYQKYNNSPKGKETRRKYYNSPEYKKARKEYHRKWIHSVKGKEYKQRHRKKYNEWRRNHYKLPEVKAAQLKTRQRYDHTPKGLERQRRNHLKISYGITVEDYIKLFNLQHGRCIICSEKPTKRRLSVDHDHKTGKIRGLLCHKCNMILGYSNDSPLILQEAIHYLERN
jgi:hypothetical protein